MKYTLKNLIKNWEETVNIIGINAREFSANLMHECISLDEIKPMVIATLIIKIGELEIEAESL